ncbi:endonuclease III domain-containing protein [Azorhizobium caulinodans]|uniref:endonuclease III domain-containing protein n=1 Tax=Azorhizobium caulinodans TaxID=7 RepID=UPI002FBD8BF7
MQQVIAEISGRFERLSLPDPTAPVWPGLRWGRFDEPLTPAFWASQAWMAKPEREDDYRLGRSLKEEVIYCLLGGHGAPAEVGLAASRRVCEVLRSTGNPKPSRVELERLLREPLCVSGRPVRYRFAAQRAHYLAGALGRLAEVEHDHLGDVALRDALCALPGIGPKTASWIVRNRRASDHVAILDVHIVRACSAIGVFPEGAQPARRYADLEQRFLTFCEATQSRASAMDAVMWSTMRSLSRGLLQQLVDQASRFTQLDVIEQRGNRPCLDQTTRVTMRPAPAGVQ